MPNTRNLISRLLTLLLTLLLGYLSIHTVNGSPANLGNLSEQFRSLTGGTPFVRTYRLLSRCSDKYVQMKLGDKKRAVDAKGLKNSDYALLKFESHPGGQGMFRIYGEYAQKYLCFSRKGRLIVRSEAEEDTCVFREKVDDNYTMLQSQANSNWYVGFSPKGKKLKGFGIRRRKRQKCFHFTSRVVSQATPRARPKYGPLAREDFPKIPVPKYR
ncbi:fibroblast growth factor 18-like isoform X2 [Pomacea canaliculata]|uniref:fibroblast growth factor 18-like isoform X2 n=1 Tax=Pomacea canaliculata TaxID=400727 RepID=UPI000D73DC75|nr:fibroblast growth factor 18-like isoform X2 [Pomacea canaliculata]